MARRKASHRISLLSISHKQKQPRASSEKVSGECKRDFSLVAALAASAVPGGGLWAGWPAGWLAGQGRFCSEEIFSASRQTETAVM